MIGTAILGVVFALIAFACFTTAWNKLNEAWTEHMDVGPEPEAWAQRMSVKPEEAK